MRKRYAVSLVAVFLIVLALVTPVFADGGYVASKNSDVFHESDCSYADSIADHNRIYFDTLEEALASGRRGCSRCNPEVGNYDRNPDSSSNSFDAVSYASGFDYGIDCGYDIGYDEGYTEGYAAGEDSGYAAGEKDAKAQAQTEYEAKLEEEISAVYSRTFWIAVFSFIPLLIFVSSILLERQKRKFEYELSDLRKQIRQQQTNNSQAERTLPRKPVQPIPPAPSKKPSVQSSAFSKIDYVGGVLILTFTSGGTYYYGNVPRSVYEEMLRAPSKGKFYHERIKGHYTLI